MNRKAVRTFAAFASDLSAGERFQAARMVAEQALGGPLDAAELALSDAIVRRATGPFFHGGLPGRKVGDFLLPAHLTGADPRSCGDEIMDRASFVYITPHLDEAQMYADLAKGTVYRVRPVGPMIVDPTELRTFLLVMRAFGPIKEMRMAGDEWLAARLYRSVKGFACSQAEVLAG